MARNNKSTNPFYPARKESLLKEIGTTVGVVVVCLVLVGVIVKNFNIYAIDARSHKDQYEADAEYEYSDDEYYSDYEEYDNSYVEESYESQDVIINDSETEFQDEPMYDSTGTVIEEPMYETEDVNSEYYVIPDSDSRYLSYSDLDGLSPDELRIARNEIYARHGRMFKDTALQSYFDSMPWYTGTIHPDNFTQSMLSAVELANAEMISSYEASKGY